MVLIFLLTTSSSLTDLTQLLYSSKLSKLPTICHYLFFDGLFCRFSQRKIDQSIPSQYLKHKKEHYPTLLMELLRILLYRHFRFCNTKVLLPLTRQLFGSIQNQSDSKSKYLQCYLFSILDLILESIVMLNATIHKLKSDISSLTSKLFCNLIHVRTHKVRTQINLQYFTFCSTVNRPKIYNQ